MPGPSTSDKVPRRIGRYDIVGTLARGTSSVIFIARTSGGGGGASISGFQRPVVIKQIAPELADKTDLVPGFLDITRTVAGIRHVNVVQIQETGHEDDHLFVVMDYLMGETASSLMKRLHARGDTLDFTLAAYIIAEASAGLEAAHEVGVLHEHLTPDDLFIGYDGTVRVLDVGIAAALARMGTQANGRREIEYASPERCKKETLDRQTDVFSLGTILWELTTGLSPFERPAEADTIRAICEEPIVAPGTVLRGLPEELSMITMRALSRDRSKRFPTAQALRRELLSFVRRLAMGTSSADNVSLIMKRLFDEDRIAKKEMLRRVESGGDLHGVTIGLLEPPPHVDRTESEDRTSARQPGTPSAAPKELVEHTTVDTSPELHAAHAHASVATARRSSLRLAWAVVLLVAIGGIVLAIILRSQQRPSVIATGAPAGSQPAETPSVSVVSAAPSAAVVAPPASVSAAQSDPPPPSDKASPREETVVRVETIPSRAAVFLNGAKKGLSPVDLKLPKSSEGVVIEIRHPGYQSLKERVVPDVNQKLRLTLVAVHHAATGTAAPIERFE